MIVSWNWLTDYLRLDLKVEELGERLTLSGLNLESIADEGGDLAIDLEVTSNRSDCLCHMGVAREIGVLLGQRPRFPEPRPRSGGRPVEQTASISIEAVDLCSRFTGCVISGVKVGPSPWWMRKRLETIGVRPISNIVDATNYVMFECGQPLHAYDLDLVAGRSLCARRARPGETLKAINNRVYELAPDMLVIADADRPVGLAGVMGGAETEIHAGTRQVLIEAARFDPRTVRRTSRLLGLASPSSFRFERPIDPEVVLWAARRCVELILETAGGKLHPGVIDVGEKPAARSPITIRKDAVERVLGIAVPFETAAPILERLGLSKEGEDGESAVYTPPSWRPDLEREIDLVEEVGRILGYDAIPQDRTVPLVSTRISSRERLESRLREILTATGFDEAVTFSLVEERLAAALDQPDQPALRIEHASRKRESYLRRSLLPSLLTARAANEARGRAEAQLFELALVYLPRSRGVLPDQPMRVGAVSGRDFRGLKGVVEVVLDQLHIGTKLTCCPVELPLFERGRAAELRLGGSVLGCIGEIAAAPRAELDLREPCSAFELALDVLEEHLQYARALERPKHFPAVVRDLSLVLNRKHVWIDIESAVVEAAGPILESVHYLDTFRGAGLADNEQSVHFSMRFRRADRTLQSEEVERAVEGVIAACRARLNARLRG